MGKSMGQNCMLKHIYFLAGKTQRSHFPLFRKFSYMHKAGYVNGIAFSWDSLEIFVSFSKRVPGTKRGWWTTCHPHCTIVELLPASVLDQTSPVQNLGMFQWTVFSRNPSCHGPACMGPAYSVKNQSPAGFVPSDVPQTPPLGAVKPCYNCRPN